MLQGSEEWLNMRSKHAITWSRAADALGIGYNSRSAYMKQKLGITPKTEANWRMLEGNKREPWAAELYYRIMAFCGSDIAMDTDAFRSDASDHRIGGSPDRIITDLTTGDRILLEIKTQPGANELREEIPVSHILQMHGLCHTYGLTRAHYICWCQHRGCLLSELTWDPRLWDFLYTYYKEFADMWAIRAIPARMCSERKQLLLDTITLYTTITAIHPVYTKALQLQPQ